MLCAEEVYVNKEGGPVLSAEGFMLIRKEEHVLSAEEVYVNKKGGKHVLSAEDVYVNKEGGTCVVR